MIIGFYIFELEKKKLANIKVGDIVWYRHSFRLMPRTKAEIILLYGDGTGVLRFGHGIGIDQFGDTSAFFKLDDVSFLI
jgi:hypothetical protein